MRRRTPAPAAVLLAFFLAGFSSAAPEAALSFDGTALKTHARTLLDLPGADFRSEARRPLEALTAELGGFFALAETSPQAFGEAVRSDPDLVRSLAAVYADARYARRLPPLPIVPAAPVAG